MIGKPDCELSRQTGFCEKTQFLKKCQKFILHPIAKFFTDMNSGSQVQVQVCNFGQVCPTPIKDNDIHDNNTMIN